MRQDNAILRFTASHHQGHDLIQNFDGLLLNLVCKSQEPHALKIVPALSLSSSAALDEPLNGEIKLESLQ